MKKLNIYGLALATIWLAVLAADSAAQDAVYRLKDAGGPSRVTGKITGVSPEGVSIDGKQVPANEIRRIAVGKEPASIARIREQLESGRYAECLAGIEKLKDLPDEPLLLQKIAYMRAYASAKNSIVQGAMDPKEAGATVAKFLNDYPNSLYRYPVLEQYGLLIFAFGKPDAAANEFKKLQQAEWKEYRWKGHFWHGRMMQLAGQLEQAKSDYEAIAADSSADPVTTQYKKLAQCELAKIEGLNGQVNPAIEKLRGLVKSETGSNPELFAYIYNAQGAVYDQAGQWKAARTAYLHTTLLFGGESEPASEALYRLAKLWPQLNQAGRANEAREELKSKFRNSYWAGIVDSN